MCVCVYSNIIQRQYGVTVESRRREVSDGDKDILKQYNQAKKKSPTQVHTVVHRIQQRWILIVLGLVFTAIVIVAVSLVRTPHLPILVIN